MALPVEIAAFFSLLREFWLLFPVMIRQVFYMSFLLLGLIGLLKLFVKE